MQSLRIGSLLLLLFWSLPALAQDSGTPGEELTLVQAVLSALTNHPDVHAALYTKQAMNARLPQKRASFFPQVTVTASFGREYVSTPALRRNGVRTLSQEQSQGVLAVSQLLFDGFSALRGLSKAKADVSAAIWAWRSTLDIATLDAIVAYLELDRQRKSYQMLKKQVDLQNRLLKQMEKWYHGGGGTKAEVFQSQSRLELSRAQYAAGLNNLEAVRVHFKRVIGIEPPDQLAIISRPTTYIFKTLDEVQRYALQHYPPIKEAQENVSAAKESVSVAKADYWPQFNLNANYTHTKNNSSSEGVNRSAEAVISMRYPLFQGGATPALVKERYARLRAEQSALDKEQRILKEKLHASWWKIQSLQKQMAHMEKHLDTGKQVVKAYHKQFHLGQRSLVDVLNAENELFAAENSVNNVSYDLRLAEFNLLFYMGRIRQALLEGKMQPEKHSTTMVKHIPDRKQKRAVGYIDLAAPIRSEEDQVVATMLTPLIKQSVATSKASVKASPTKAIWLRVIKKRANLRAQPAAGAKVVGRVLSGARLDFLDQQEDWLKVKDAYGKTGWIAAFLTQYKTPRAPEEMMNHRSSDAWRWVRVIRRRANFRREPKIRSKVIGYARYDTPLHILAHKEGWIKVRDPQGLVGWVAAFLTQYIPKEKQPGQKSLDQKKAILVKRKESDLKKKAVTVSLPVVDPYVVSKDRDLFLWATVAFPKANLRQHPITTSKRIALFKRGTTLRILNEKHGWLYVQDKTGRVGWVARFLTRRVIALPTVSPKVKPDGAKQSVLTASLSSVNQIK
ncbi:TolC family outer membrane protein [Magnetococcales bacterium HHB-1]